MQATLSRFVLSVCAAALLCVGTASAQDMARIVTKADVEKATGMKFKDGVQTNPDEIQFAQDGGDLLVGVNVDKREANTVRSWEATMKKMRPDSTVDPVPGVGKDAIYFGTRADQGKVLADFDKPRVQLSVAVSGAKSPDQARQIVTALARAIAPRVGK